jgi:hypothetical protein
MSPKQRTASRMAIEELALGTEFLKKFQLEFQSLFQNILSQSALQVPTKKEPLSLDNSDVSMRCEE